MRSILKNNSKTKKYLESLPKIYMVACWAGFGVREFPFAGKCDENGVPYVYDYEDRNGTCDEFCLRKLTHTTTGQIYAWTASKKMAEEIADAMNHARGEDWRIDFSKKFIKTLDK